MKKQIVRPIENTLTEIDQVSRVMTLSFRLAKRREFKPLSQAQLEALIAQDGFALLNENRERLTTLIRSSCVIVALIDGAIAGVAWCDWERSDVIEGVHISIHPNYRNNGLESVFMASMDPGSNPLLTVKKEEKEPPEAVDHVLTIEGKTLNEIEREVISRTILNCNGVRVNAARALGIRPAVLRDKLLGVKSQVFSEINSKRVAERRNKETEQRANLLLAIEQANGSRKRAAAILGINVRTFYDRVAKLKIDLPKQNLRMEERA